MALQAGTKIGPYEIIAPVGAGGMGEVYRARDTRLGRDVAVKILPEAVAQDEDRLRRFEQEARAIAALNHPNILSIHDTGTQDHTRYLVTEMLEGETLRQRLASGALPVRKAVDYAQQMARGLSAAHEKGIAHRDLKPENLFITKDGRLKILDFGLAKQDVEHADVATATKSIPVETTPGTVLGTAGYMSPEQVRGKSVDHRSDIFTMGAILYEMLSGKRAFHGETAADTMSAILKEEPPELTETNRNLPAGLERIVRHCLEKNLEERFQSAHDIAFALDALTGMSNTSGAAAKIDLGPRVRVGAALAAAVAILALAAGLGIGFYLSSTPPPPIFQPVTFRLGSMGDARYTPDGDVVYSAAWDGKRPELYVGRVGSPGDRALGIHEADVLAVSKTGEMAILLDRTGVNAYARRGTLARVPLSGGAPRPVVESVQFADWSNDGSQLAVTRFVPASGSWQLEYPVGKVLYETKGWISHPRISPDGQHIAFLDHPAPMGDDRGGVAVIDLQRKKKTLTKDFSSAQGLTWHTNDEIWFTGVRSGISRSLFAVTLSGKERPLLSGPANMLLEDVGPKGELLLKAENIRHGILGVAPGESQERELAWFNWSSVADITADGKTLLLEEEGDAGGSNYLVFLRGTDGSPAVQLGEGNAYAISPDGKWVLTQLPGDNQPIRLLPTGTGEVRVVTRDRLQHVGATWFPDSRHILFMGIEANHGPRDYILDSETGEERPITPEGIWGTTISPDGKWAVVRTADGTRQLWPVEGGEAKAIHGLTANEGVFRWTADSKSLYVTPRGGPDALPRKVYILDPETGKRELWKTLNPPDLSGITSVGAPVISRDRSAYAFVYVRSLGDLYVVKGVK